MSPSASTLKGLLIVGTKVIPDESVQKARRDGRAFHAARAQSGASVFLSRADLGMVAALQKHRTKRNDK
jgi:hypothetical protein